jgi:hypothetical protein
MARSPGKMDGRAAPLSLRTALKAAVTGCPAILSKCFLTHMPQTSANSKKSPKYFERLFSARGRVAAGFIPDGVSPPELSGRRRERTRVVSNHATRQCHKILATDETRNFTDQSRNPSVFHPCSFRGSVFLFVGWGIVYSSRAAQGLAPASPRGSKFTPPRGGYTSCPTSAPSANTAEGECSLLRGKRREVCE